MLMFFASDVVVSKGYQNAPALKFSEKGDFVRFRVGQKIYDPRAEDNHRWINITIKSFDGRPKALHSGGIPCPQAGGLVHHPGSGGQYLQACPDYHRQAHADA